MINLNKEFAERLRTKIDEAWPSQRQFALALGIPANSLSNYLNGRIPDLALVVRFAEALKVSPAWLLFGDKAEERGKASDYSYIPLYDIRVAAGDGRLVETEEVKDFLAFKQDWIRGILRVNPNDLRLVHVDGDSMEPTLHHGDIILVNAGNHAVVRDGIYVVRFGQAVMVKRLQLLPGNKLKVKSDNETGYEPFTIDLEKLGEEVAVIGRVVWAGRGL